MLESRHCGPCCRSGEIGRRKGLKIPRTQKVHAGSIPASGTTYQEVVSSPRYRLTLFRGHGRSCGCSSELSQAQRIHRFMHGGLGEITLWLPRGDRACALHSPADLTANVNWARGERETAEPIAVKR